jgi:hypothetical protein
MTFFEGEMSSKPLRGFQSLGLGELGLALVKGPETVGFEFEGAGDVESVIGPDSEFGAIAAPQIGTEFEGMVWKKGLTPKPAESISLQVVVDAVRISQ